ncbi:hypothetical protein [Pelosinus sp. IPA-1]|uniref:hypothetical protein n=1 Tax=Pelosinus sp. IPA-1 TaxID=3029569 RepID=UPI00243624C5|nr:hypothetical protein [Pelosinus sp. IPA-1]GMB00091.1 hypothetical protein PIPA1_28900 [Pelosinus sp. IPA-1]
MYPINENWRIETDPHNVILQRRKVNARGKNVGTERWENAGYYPTHRDALKAMVEYEIRVPKYYQEMVTKIDTLIERVFALQWPVQLLDDSVTPLD